MWWVEQMITITLLECLKRKQPRQEKPNTKQLFFCILLSIQEHWSTGIYYANRDITLLRGWQTRNILKYISNECKLLWRRLWPHIRVCCGFHENFAGEETWVSITHSSSAALCIDILMRILELFFFQVQGNFRQYYFSYTLKEFSISLLTCMFWMYPTTAIRIEDCRRFRRLEMQCSVVQYSGFRCVCPAGVPYVSCALSLLFLMY